MSENHAILGQATYRVLGAALSLGEFTVPALARFSGVNDNTVWSVVRRHATLFVASGETESTGARGGQPRKYCLTDAQRQEIRKRLHMLYKELTPIVEESTQAGAGNIPAGLLVAEDIYLRKLLPAAGVEKKTLLKLAHASARSGVKEAERLLRSVRAPEQSNALRLHLCAVDTLRHLWHEFEGPHPAPELIDTEIDSRLSDLADQFSVVGDTARAYLIVKLREHRLGAATVEAAERWNSVRQKITAGVYSGTSPWVPLHHTAVLLDAIPKKDKLTPHVQDILGRYMELNVVEVEPKRIGRALPPLPTTPEAGCYFLTYDSRQAAYRPLVREASLRYGSRLIVFDVSYDSKLRDEVYTANGCYLHDASNLKEPVLIAVLKKTSF